MTPNTPDLALWQTPAQSAPIAASVAAIVFHLAMLGERLPGLDNPSRAALRQIVALSSAAPQPAGLRKARELAEQATEHLAQDLGNVGQIGPKDPQAPTVTTEDWLLCAVVALLSQLGLLTGWLQITSGHQQGWMRLTDELARELGGEALPPTVDGTEDELFRDPLFRRVKLLELNLWLSHVQAMSGPPGLGVAQRRRVAEGLERDTLLAGPATLQ